MPRAMSKQRRRSRGPATTRVYGRGTTMSGAARRRRNVTVAMAGIVVVVVLILSAMAGPSVLFGSGATAAPVATATIPPLVVLPSDQPYVTILPIAP